MRALAGRGVGGGAHDHLGEVRAAFVVLRPAAVDELQLLPLDQATHRSPDASPLLIVPPLEEGLLGPGEPPGGVEQERVDDAVEDILHRGVLDGIIRAGVALVHRLEPARVRVRVRRHVHGELVGDR